MFPSAVTQTRKGRGCSTCTLAGLQLCPELKQLQLFCLKLLSQQPLTLTLLLFLTKRKKKHENEAERVEEKEVNQHLVRQNLNHSVKGKIWVLQH